MAASKQISRDQHRVCSDHPDQNPGPRADPGDERFVSDPVPDIKSDLVEVRIDLAQAFAQHSRARLGQIESAKKGDPHCLCCPFP